MAGIVAFFIWNKIKADTQKYNPVVEQNDIKTTPSNQIVDGPDTRNKVPVPILMYHHIRNYNDPNDKVGTNLSVPPENFKAQIDYLKNNGFTTITFREFLDFPTRKLPDKPIILTFDDGYQDTYDVAFHNLKSNEQIGVFYIISGFLGRPEFMTAPEVKEISDAGMEIGSHTIDHPDLTKLSAEKLSTELIESKSKLESIIGRTIVSFCYPAGQQNAAVDAAVANAGYKTATTTNMAISSTSEEKFALSRLRINPEDSLSYFADKIVNYKSQK